MGLILSCNHESCSETVLLPGAWDSCPDSVPPCEMLSFSSVMLT